MRKDIKIAILDDYQNAALTFADWSSIAKTAEITVFEDHQTDENEIRNRLLPYQVISVMRERTPLSGQLLKQLPNLKLIVSTGPANNSIDMKVAADLGIMVQHTGYVNSGAPELTWGLLLAAARNIPEETTNIRQGKWQTTIGKDLSGKTIGIIGLGRIGGKVASYAKAFDMKVIAWSQNLTTQKAAEAGAAKVSKEELFTDSDFITIHVPLSEGSRGLVSGEYLNLMKPTAILINTSRGPIVNEKALIDALAEKRIAGAVLDVYDIEPMAADHPFRQLTNVTVTPHIGYVTENTYKVFYGDTVKLITEWISQ